MPKSKGILIILTLLVASVTLALFFSRNPEEPTISEEDQGNPAVLISENPESIINNSFVESNTGLDFELPGLSFNQGNLLSLGEEGVTRFAASYNSTLSYEETKTQVKALLTQNNITYEETDYELSTGYTGTLTQNGTTANFTIGVADASGDHPVFMTIFFESL